MIRINANVSKKVPIPALDFSSQSFMAGIEIEVSDGASDAQIQERLKQVYRLLEQTVDAEILAQNGQKPAEPGPNTDPKPRWNPDNGNGNGGNGDGKNGQRKASAAQVKAVFAIAKSLDMSRETLADLLFREFHVEKPEELTLRSASLVIEKLKSMQKPA